MHPTIGKMLASEFGNGCCRIVGVLGKVLTVTCCLSMFGQTTVAATPPVSAAVHRFRAQGEIFEDLNEFYSTFKFTPVEGIGFQEGVSRRDPTSVIKVGDLYYVWYTRPPEGLPVVGWEEADDTHRAYHWDLADIWYATSPDGRHWTEKGLAVGRGPQGEFDARSVFTPDVLVADGRYYLFYQAAGSLAQGYRRPGPSKFGGDFRNNVIGMSWADSPNGPWHRWSQPILQVGGPGDWDANVVHDPSLVVREGKFWLYYKSSPRQPGLLLPGQEASKQWADLRIGWGVAIADRPEGPYVKSLLNPVICGGHEVIVWPYRKGVCALLIQGPEKGSLQFAEDGLNFYPMAHGLDVPEAAGVFREGNFTDTDIQSGQGITWGLFHKLGPWNYLMRFDCDLSLPTGEKKRYEYEALQKWRKE